MSTATVTGTGEAGTVTRDDLEAKLRELRGDVAETADSARPTLVAVGVAVAVGALAVAFLLGSRRGRRRRTFVEIRRL